LGILAMALQVYRSRGTSVLSGNTLTVPGSAAVDVDQVESIDKTRWDRKGIVVIEYKSGNGQPATLQLNDMIYHRAATDEIVSRLERHLNPEAAASTSDSAAPAADASGV